MSVGTSRAVGGQAGSSTDLKKIQDLGKGVGREEGTPPNWGIRKKKEVSLDLELDGYWVLTNRDGLNGILCEGTAKMGRLKRGSLDL